MIKSILQYLERVSDYFGPICTLVLLLHFLKFIGGAFGKMEAAREEEYFYKKQKDQLEKMKSDLEKDVARIEAEKQQLEEKLAKQKRSIEELEKESIKTSQKSQDKDKDYNPIVE
jgi:septal ring factor EnvC (AmiA/AmiB activator)